MPNYVIEINIRGGRFGLPPVQPSAEDSTPENPEPYGRFDGYDEKAFGYAQEWLEKQAAFADPKALPSPARDEEKRQKAAAKAEKPEAKPQAIGPSAHSHR